MFKKILLVDDDNINNHLSSLTLHSINVNYEIVVKANGREALDYLRLCSISSFSTMPELIILDIMMPVMGGFELLEDPLWKSLFYNGAIIILTEHSCARSRRRAMELGVKHFLEKPLSAKKLEEILREEMYLHNKVLKPCDA